MGLRAIVRDAVDWASFFMSLGVESMPNYGLEADLMICVWDRTHLLLVTHVFERIS